MWDLEGDRSGAGEGGGSHDGVLDGGGRSSVSVP